MDIYKKREKATLRWRKHGEKEKKEENIDSASMK